MGGNGMPGYKGHLVGGCVAFGITLYVLRSVSPGCAVMGEWLLCTLAGSLFPDIDVKSRGQNYFYKFLLVILAFLLLQGSIQLFIVLSILAFIPMLVRHRGLFHQLWFIISFPLFVVMVLSAYFPQYGTILLFDVFFFIVGAISHLWLDLGMRKMMGF
jgi:membrane-bound metal-dependent hydrolase YbcI (DUF457 family)